MWIPTSLRARLFLILAALIAVTLMGGSVMMWYAHQMDHLFRGMIDQDVAALQAAEDLENALVNQKGFVSYYFLDDDPVWLKKLGEYRQAFKVGLKEVREVTRASADKETIDKIEAEYAEYIENKDRVISLYKAGQKEAGAGLHKKVRKHFFKILELCEHYRDVHNKRIKLISVESHTQAKRLRFIAGIAMGTATLLGVLLATVLVAQILNPLRRLASDGDSPRGHVGSGDEVKAVSQRVRTLLKDVDQTKVQLEQSQAHLLQSEKLALVGKLAAGVAHSIRNPLTSVKMRLFSMGRTLDLSADQKEDFDVISEEIRHVDNIVQNFLEFSRPPKLKMQKVNPSDVVDMAVQLLRHRLESYGADVRLERRQRLPEIWVDPEQLKEVLVNLLVNACEAMGGSGHIVISEREGVVEPPGRVVVIQVSDSGPGVPAAIQDRLFEPFFSTKEEGSGLGLSIAARIVEEHGGWLIHTSRKGKGAMFTITLPCKEEQNWVRS